MLTYLHLAILFLFRAISGYSFEKAKTYEKRNHYFLNGSSQSSDSVQGEVTQYLKKHPRDSRLIKHNYFFLDGQPAKPPGCLPCRKSWPFCIVWRFPQSHLVW